MITAFYGSKYAVAIGHLESLKVRVPMSRAAVGMRALAYARGLTRPHSRS